MSTSDPELDRLAARLEEALGKRERLLAGLHAGMRTQVDLPRLCARYAELGTPEAYQAAREAGRAAPPERAAAWRRLALGFLDWLSFSRGAAAHARALGGLAEGEVRLEQEALRYPDAERALRHAYERERRAALARGVAQARSVADDAWAEARERALEVQHQQGLGSEAALGELLGLDLGKLAASAEAALRASRDPAQDVLDYLLRRERSEASVGEGTRAELELALELGSLREHFPPGQLWLLGERLAAELGLQALASGALSTDLEERPGRFAEPRVAAFAVPGEVALLLAPARTPADVDRLFGALGQAWHLAGVAGSLPIADRALLDPALPRATGLLLASALTDPAWHGRTLRLPSRAAGEASRFFALRQLMALRLASARLLAARELSARGAGEAAREAYRERMNAACAMDWGFAGWAERDLATAASELRAFGLAACLGRALLERFNEDWYRNPHAGEFLRELWRQGGALATDAFGEPDLAQAAIALAERAAS